LHANLLFSRSSVLVSIFARKEIKLSQDIAQDVVEDDGSLRIFWLDYTEVNGSLCLFGKVKNKQSICSSRHSRKHPLLLALI
jgi:hypothetical protein